MRALLSSLLVALVAGLVPAEAQKYTAADGKLRIALA